MNDQFIFRYVQTSGKEVEVKGGLRLIARRLISMQIGRELAEIGKGAQMFIPKERTNQRVTEIAALLKKKIAQASRQKPENWILHVEI